MENNSEILLNETAEKETAISNASADSFLDSFLKGHNTGYEVVNEPKPIAETVTETPPVPETDAEPKKKRGRPAKDKQTPPEQVINSSFITGSLLLLLVDLLFPIIMSVGNNYYDPKNKVRPEDLQMTGKQKADLEPLFDAVAKEINLNLSPIVTACIALAGIYGVNLVAARANANKVEK